jgi:demethylsterigmatocystin 6-O-methyltransferase
MDPASRVIIIDMVMPNVHVPRFLCFIDISMMAFGGMERTEAHWLQLLGAAGLRVRRIESLDASSPTSDYVIEACLG